MAFEYAYVLTGGIATGKSTVGEIFHGYGVNIVDADTIAHEVLDQQQEQIEKHFGAEYIGEDKVNRKALGARIFKDIESKKWLENLLHPLIYQEIKWQSEMLDRLARPYLIDIPLFFETKRYPIEKIIVVYTTEDRQLERLMQRNGFDQVEAQQRIDAQLSIETKKELATYIIDNRGDLHALQSECDKIYHLLFQQ